MCSIHTPTCLIPDCHETRSEHGLYCTSHSCCVKDCGNVINGGSWCKLHKTCKVRDCTQPRASLPGPLPTSMTADTDGIGSLLKDYDFEVCWDHMPARCRYPDCTATLDREATPGVLFCAAHECRFPGCHAVAPDAVGSEPGAEGTVVGDGGYCNATHACAVVGCAAPRASDSALFCGIHHTAMLREALAASAEQQQQQQYQPQQQQIRGGTYEYGSPTEEVLSRRLREERDRLEADMRLRATRAWRDGVPFTTAGGWSPGLVQTWGKRGGSDEDRERERERDSGIGTSPESSDCTVVI
ncbi:hypothetical protein ACRALDRAFT_2029366 [Sodiomyces alcalophilus JCM 7366]|uniref:uncharacterized protein n=1 Tax=Sodiomyces alcalophilus JCM 7366 TaxID=591952 RepID=UPI0039B5F1D2